jgi:hypothetical protein
MADLLDLKYFGGCGGGRRGGGARGTLQGGRTAMRDCRGGAMRDCRAGEGEGGMSSGGMVKPWWTPFLRTYRVVEIDHPLTTLLLPTS